MIKAIIFDFDGVIVESVDIKTEAFAKLFAKEGKEAVKEIVNYHLNNTGVSRYDKFKFIYKEILHRPLDNEKFLALCDKFSQLVVDSVVKAPYTKGVRGFLENNASEYQLFVISATPQEEMKRIIRERKMTHFFKRVYGAPIKKTDAVQDILIKEEIKSNNILYVGDSMSDYIAAKNNALNFVARINNNKSIFANIDCIKVKDLKNLTTIIESFNDINSAL
jgi:phosphoglycolate phosphatase-like HAD superfamily hydrolase